MRNPTGTVKHSRFTGHLPSSFCGSGLAAVRATVEVPLQNLFEVTFDNLRSITLSDT